MRTLPLSSGFLPVWIMLLILPLAAQQPGYFVLGGEQFRGIQVYDAIQDQNHNYLFATDEGIYTFDFQQFNKLPCAEANSPAVFNFVADRRGRVYCCNLNHQIFRIENGQCSLIYTLSEDEIGIDLELAVGPNGEVLASARKIIALSSEGKVLWRISTRNRYWGLPFRSQDGAVFYHLPATDSVLRVGPDGPLVHALTGMDKGRKLDVFTFFRIGESCYAVGTQLKESYLFNIQQFSIKPLPNNPCFSRSKSIRIYPVGDQTWIAGGLPGANCLNQSPATRTFPLLYQDYFISDVMQDHEGNLLLSTFDHGILVIPDQAVPDVIGKFQDDPVTALHVDAASRTLYLGTSEGKVLHYADGKLRELKPEGMRAIEIFCGEAGFPYLLYDDKTICALNLANGSTARLSEAVLKDAVIMDARTAYLGTNIGLLKCTWNATGKATVLPLQHFRMRVYRLARVGQSQSLIVSTSLGLFLMDSTGHRSLLQDEGRDIFPTAMAAWGDKVYAATLQNDILVLQDGRIIDRIRPQQPRPEIFRKLVVQEGGIIARSSHSIALFGMQGEMLKNISRIYGFPDRRVFDFAVQGNLLWVSHSNGVQAVDLTVTTATPEAPHLRMAAISVNDQPVDAQKGNTLNSHQRKVQFTLTSPSLRHRERIRIHYRLEGYDETWLSKPNDGSPILYNALAPGTYTFRARAELQGQFSEWVTYRFEITPPLYVRWWFLLSAGLLLAGLVTGLFRWQLRIQRRKAQQINALNASRLTAIQSQMNPHFLFNALNSIQALVLKGDIENSYSYITTFSNLVRSTLLYSGKDFIDFSQETKLLRLYLSLEQLRFKKDLVWEMDEGGIEDIQLPPLLIQPFIENALVHGLLHKTGEKRLTIRFELRESLICTIEDNGIGREQARIIRERQRGEHESFAEKAIRKRFDILSDIFRGEFGYEYEDLTENGVPSGTRIRLRIPVQRSF